jgi:hypothetical protein
MDERIKPSRGGRPRKHVNKLRHTIGVRVSTAELTTLRERAATAGMKISQFLRVSALTRRMPAPPVPAVNRDQYVSLARLSANLNQLAKHANSGGQVSVENALLLQVIELVGQLRLALMGVRDDR